MERGCEFRSVVRQALVQTTQALPRFEIATIHILHAGDADPRRFVLGGAEGLGHFVLGRRGNVLLDETHRIVAEQPPYRRQHQVLSEGIRGRHAYAAADLHVLTLGQARHLIDLCVHGLH